MSHKLHIETGRHQNTPREERICHLCTLNKVEDEEHFITECPAYSKLRTEHLTNVDIHIDQLLTQEPLALATFLRKAYTLREELLKGQPGEQYHVAHKNKLQLTLRKGIKNTQSVQYHQGWIKNQNTKCFKLDTTTPI